MRKLHAWIASLLLLLAGASPAQARTHFELHGSAGHAQQSGEVIPKLGQFGAGVTFGWKLGSWVLALSSDYYKVLQYSEVTYDDGNRRGSYFSKVTPVLQYRVRGNWWLRIEPELLGEYKVANLTELGQTVKYSSPVGAKVALYLPGVKRRWGVQAQYLKFRKQTMSPGTTESLGARALTHWQIGIVFSVYPLEDDFGLSAAEATGNDYFYTR